MTRIAVLAVAVLLAGRFEMPATAQTVYRCGNAYGQDPCPQGRVIESDDARTTAQRDEALRLAADERRRGDEMERERLRREAAIRPALASALSSAPAPAATPAAGKKPSAKGRQTKPSKERRLAVVASAPTRPKKNPQN